MTPAAGSQGHLVASACLPVLLVIVNTMVPRSDFRFGFRRYNMCVIPTFSVPESSKIQILLRLLLLPFCCESVSSHHL